MSQKKHQYVVVRKRINGEEIERIPAPDIYTGKDAYERLCKNYNTCETMKTTSTGMIELHINGNISCRCWYEPWDCTQDLYNFFTHPMS